jgi:hypothetical protein
MFRGRNLQLMNIVIVLRERPRHSGRVEIAHRAPHDHTALVASSCILHSRRLITRLGGVAPHRLIDRDLFLEDLYDSQPLSLSFKLQNTRSHRVDPERS